MRKTNLIFVTDALAINPEQGHTPVKHKPWEDY